MIQDDIEQSESATQTVWQSLAFLISGLNLKEFATKGNLLVYVSILS